jgi:hypothetical protein
MSSSTTRIADLPENITIQMPGSMTNGFNNQGNGTGNGSGPGAGSGNGSGMGSTTGFDQNTYMPMNVHPNPYGPQTQSAVMPLPQSQPNNKHGMGPNLGMGPNQGMGQGQNQLTYEQQMMLQNMPQHRLPSRDIPIDTAGYLQDEQTQPNYIPPVKLTSDYINEYEEKHSKKTQEHEQKKHRGRMIDNLLTELQTPMFVAILFFIFQMPIVNTLLYKNFSFLSIYNSDGNINFYGLFLKSMMFGSAYYSLSRFTNYISEI